MRSTRFAPVSLSSRRLAVALAPLACVVALGGCDDTEPLTGASHPAFDPPTLDESPLLSGGEGVLVSAEFDGLELEPAVGEDGDTIPDRWTNLQVTVDGEEVGVRRLTSDRVGFDVPLLPAGTYAIDVRSAQAMPRELSARVLGVLSSDRPNIDEGCSLFDEVNLVRVAEAIVFHTRCAFNQLDHAYRQGYAMVSPPIAGQGLRWLPGLFFDDEAPAGQTEDRIQAGPSVRDGHLVVKQGATGGVPDMAVWRVGSDAEFVASLTCFEAPLEQTYHDATVAEVAPGVCLAVSDGTIRRNGVPIANVDRSFAPYPIVVASDGWSALRFSERLVVFDATGAIVHREDAPTGSMVRDVAFSEDGRLFVARDLGEPGILASELQEVERSTGELLDAAAIAGELLALRFVDGALWALRKADVPGEEWRLLVDVYDPETLDLERTVAIAPTYSSFAVASLVGSIPVLEADVTGTRAHVVGSGRVTGIPRSVYMHVVEVF